MLSARIITYVITAAAGVLASGLLPATATAQGIPALSTEVQSVQSSVNTLQTSINALQTQTAGLPALATAIQALQASVNGLQVSVNALQTAANNAGGGSAANVNVRYTPPITDFAAQGVTANVLNAAVVPRTIKAELLMAGATAVLFDNQQLGPGLTAVTSGPLTQIFFGRGFVSPQGAVLRVTVLDAGGSRSDIRASIQVLEADGTSGPALAAE